MTEKEKLEIFSRAIEKILENWDLEKDCPKSELKKKNEEQQPKAESDSSINNSETHI